MTQPCTHIPVDLDPPQLTADGCEDCLAMGKRDWVHLRFCQSCGRVGCCNSSPGRHATAHNASTGHPMVRSFEPGEDWWFCFEDNEMFLIDGAPSAPSYA